MKEFIREIDLKDWVASGAGATATAYNHKNNPELTLKLFVSGITGKGYAETEYRISRKVDALGLNTPEAIEVVRSGDKMGVIYQRISSKVSFSRLCVDNPDKIEEYAEMFADECRILHSKNCDQSDFPSRKVQVLKEIATHQGYTQRTKKILTAAINCLEDTSTCLHGGLQPGNLIASGDKRYWIDLGFFAWGNPIFDLACLFFFCRHPIGLFVGSKLCHLSRRQMKRFWKAFAGKYSENPAELTRVAKEYVPVYLVYTIRLENYSGITAALFDEYINACCLRRKVL